MEARIGRFDRCRRGSLTALIRLNQPQELAELLQARVPELHSVLRNADAYYEELLLLDPAKPTRPRRVISAHGVLRLWQSRLYSRLLMPNGVRSPYSHGGVAGRNILTNVKPHLGQSFVFTADIASFYPNIQRERIYRLFAHLGCSDEVARLCTRLCTYRHRLEQGILTSPILAEQLMHRVDDRISSCCHKLGLVYTRFVDDIAISGRFSLKASGLPDLVYRVLAEHGFRCNHTKTSFGDVDRGASITHLRFPKGHPDVERSYAQELERQLADAANLGRCEQFDGPNFTEAQIHGRVRFVSWVNPGRRKRLYSLMAKVDWARVRLEARRRGLESVAKRLVRRPKV
jgi:RNA-directed DNA polymerase